MNNKEFKEFLIDNEASDQFLNWLGDRDFATAYADCEEVTWLIWLYKLTNPDDKRKLVLLGGKLCEPILPLMKDKRSRDAVQACLDYGNGLIGDEELNRARGAAWDAAYADAADADAAYADAADADATWSAVYANADAAAAYADAAASFSADADAYAAAEAAYAATWSAYAATWSAYADAAAYYAGLKLNMADIFRSVVKLEDFLIYEERF